MQMPSRPLTQQEQSWTAEILRHPEWSQVNLNNIYVFDEQVSENMRTMVLSRDATPLPGLRGTMGYLGRIEVRTADNFGLTVTLDQRDGSLEELHVDFLDLEEPGDRTKPEEWQELAHVYTKM